MSCKNKRIRYRHVTALRDLGGIFNANHIKIKKGLIYRSSYLGKMDTNEADAFVEHFNIGSVIDLRSDEEVYFLNDLKSNKADYYHFPVLTNEDNPAVTKENRNDLLFDIVKNKGGALNHLEEKYRKMVSDERSLSYFRKIFDILLKDDKKAVVYHCAQGKDRTGVCSALILLALGVDRKSILKDYMKFNTPYKFKNVTISVVAALRFFSINVSVSLYHLQMAHASLMRAVFDEIDHKYGSDKDFLINALNLDNEKLEVLREKYTEK